MNIGLLWFDDSGKDIAEKVTAAARAHRRKYGTEPDTCYCHPEMLESSNLKPDDKGRLMVGGVQVKPLASVLRHHYWIGCEEGVKAMTVKEIMDMTPQQFELFIADCDEKEQDYRDEQEQVRRPM